MNKQDNKLALSVLAALASGIALIYTMIAYYHIIFAVAGMSIIFLICAFILTQNIITFSTMKSKSLNVHIKDCVDDISAQIETMGNAQSQIGKATYLYTKQAAQTVTTLENHYTESQETLYKNLAALSSAQNKATKLMIKYDQSNTTKVISTIKDLRNQLSETMIQGFDQIQPNNTEIISALVDIVNYLKAQSASMDKSMGLQLNNVAHELQNIAGSIQRVQLPMQGIVQTIPVSNTNPPSSNIPFSSESAPAGESSETPAEPIVHMEETDTQTIENATEVVDEFSSASIDTADIFPEADEIITDTTVRTDESAPESASRTSEENIATAEAVSETDEPVADSVDITDESNEMIPEQEETSNTVEETKNPNDLLSADEIAALFAAAEPTPKKEMTPVISEDANSITTENEKPFTPTFTVVGKSTEDDILSPEETTVPAISDIGSDPNKQLSPDEIAALFAAAEPAPKKNSLSTAKENKDANTASESASIPPVSEDENRQLSADEIAALFAAAEPAPKKTEPAEAVTPASEPASVTPVSEDPNKQLSPDEIAALFASLG